MDCEFLFREALVSAGEEGSGHRFHLMPVELWDMGKQCYRPTLLWAPLTAGGTQKGARAVVLVPDLERELPNTKRREWPGLRAEEVEVGLLRLMIPVEASTARLAMGIMEAEIEELGSQSKFPVEERLQYYQVELAAWAKTFEMGFAGEEVRELAVPAQARDEAEVRKRSRAWLTLATRLDGMLEAPGRACEVEEKGRSPWSTIVVQNKDKTLALVGPAPRSREVKPSELIILDSIGPGQRAAQKMLALAARAAGVSSALRQCEVYDEFRETHPLATWTSRLGFYETQNWMEANRFSSLEVIPLPLWGFSDGREV